jgi:hypothetical protein
MTYLEKEKKLKFIANINKVGEHVQYISIQMGIAYTSLATPYPPRICLLYLYISHTIPQSYIP